MSFITSPLQAFRNWMTLPFRKRVYSFSEGSASDSALLSMKGANLCEMYKNKKLHVPPGVVISSAASMEFLETDLLLPSALVDEYTRAIHCIERQFNLSFGGLADHPPFVLIVRGGALIPMPQFHPFCMQTYESASESAYVPGAQKSMVVGLNDEVVEKISILHSERTALRIYSEFLYAFGTIVYEVLSFHANIKLLFHIAYIMYVYL